jgi:hypothetical protein
MPGPVVQPSPSARQEQQRLGGAATVRSEQGGLDWEISGDVQRQSAAYRDPNPPLGPPYRERVRVESFGFWGSGSARLVGLRLEGGTEVRGYGVSSTMLSEETPDSHRTAGTWLAASWQRRVDDATSLSVSPGLRVDWSSLVDGLLASPEASASLSGQRFAARLSVGNAFSPPSLADHFCQEGVLARPNPNLEPERVRGEVEGTVALRKAEIGPAAVGLRLSAFRADVDGMILWLPDHRFVWQPNNFDVDRRGWEAEADVRFPGDRVRARVSVSGSWTAISISSAGTESPPACRISTVFSPQPPEGTVTKLPVERATVGVRSSKSTVSFNTNPPTVAARRTVIESRRTTPMTEETPRRS